MKIVNFKSEEIVSPFAPEWDYYLAEMNIEGIDFESIARLILQKEKEIVGKYPPSNKGSVDAYTGLGSDSLSSRYESFNLFSWDDPEIKKLFEIVKNGHSLFLEAFSVPKTKVWIQCWANVLRDGQDIKPHIHSTHKYCYLGGHITVQCNDTSTVYINPINTLNDPQQYFSKNVVGQFTIFQNNIPHYTTPHHGDKERISIAFDIIMDEDINKPNNVILLEE